MEYDTSYRTVSHYFGTDPEPMLVRHGSRLEKDRPVLDVGAGQGRNTFYLAERGFEVHAIDPSKVAVQIVKERSGKSGLKVQAFASGFESFHPGVEFYSGILLFGLIQLLSRNDLKKLIRKVNAWTHPGSLVFVTAFTTADPSYARLARECRKVGRHSFVDMHGNTSTFLEPGEILTLFGNYETIHHWEGMGPEHRHGQGAPERHAMVEAIFLQPGL